MATTSVTEGKRQWSDDDLLCKCEQVVGVLAAMASSEASEREIKDAIWGAHSLACEAQQMALSKVYPEGVGREG